MSLLLSRKAHACIYPYYCPLCTSMPASTRVPPEVLVKIFMHLRPFDEDFPLEDVSRRTYRFTGLSLGRCALVCRTWLEPVRTVLYGQICLHDVGQNMNLLRSLQANPSLAGLVKSFKLAKTYKQPKTMRCSSDERPKCLSRLLSIIKPSLHTLNITDARFLQKGEFRRTSLKEVTLGSNEKFGELAALSHATYLPTDLQKLHIRSIHIDTRDEYTWWPLGKPPKMKTARHFRCLTTLYIASALREEALLCFIKSSAQSLRNLHIQPDPYVRASASILPYIPELKDLTLVLISARNRAMLEPDDLKCLSPTITSLFIVGVTAVHFPTIVKLVHLLTDIAYLPNMQDLPYIDFYWSDSEVQFWQVHGSAALNTAIQKVLRRFASSWEPYAKVYRNELSFWRKDIIALAAARDP